MSQRATLKDIADELGYSKNTVSLALRNSPQIPETTRRKVRRTAEKLGYQANAVVSHLMAQLRASQTPRFQAKLALINANPDKRAFSKHPTIPTYVSGCERRAAQLGYDFDQFWLHEPEMNPRRLINIFNTRNIKGLILVGLMQSSELPKEYSQVWDQFACAVTGVRTKQPTLSYCCADHHDLTIQACDNALELGYKRPALVLDDVIDRLVERRFSAGFLIGQQRFKKSDRLPPFLEYEDARNDLELFRSWLEEHQPDVIFTLYNSVISWLKKLGYKIPRDLGIIQLEWRDTDPDIAGMHQHNDMAGEAAVDMVISQIHNNEFGPPEYPRSTYIGATWQNGKTVRAQAARV